MTIYGRIWSSFVLCISYKCPNHVYTSDILYCLTWLTAK